MRILFFITLFIINSCTQHSSKKMKYDFVQEINYKNDTSYSSVVLEAIQDSVYKYYYFDLDSNFLIEEIDKYDYLSKEFYMNNYYFLYGIIKLKLNAQKGEEWKTQYEIDYQDSISVIVLNIAVDTTMNGIKIDKCYVYDLKYNKASAGEDYMDFRLFFDPERKITIRKEYYSNNRLKGSETLVSESNIIAQD